ncbi:hypothetical protein [Agromyces protaetiae]|uniref:hypothetical protein n=1 Tax=Agromyces protaetiae TaxID=2509455 RepID=UPI0013EAABF3|nr:hypothetical protein [Agromyces protaetiae]
MQHRPSQTRPHPRLAGWAIALVGVAGFPVLLAILGFAGLVFVQTFLEFPNDTIGYLFIFMTVLAALGSPVTFVLAVLALVFACSTRQKLVLWIAIVELVLMFLCVGYFLFPNLLFPFWFTS